MKENIDHVTAESGFVNLSKRTESQKRTASKLNLKIAKKMSLHNTVNSISFEDEILASMVLECDKKPTTFLITTKPHKVKKGEKKRGLLVQPP